MTTYLGKSYSFGLPRVPFVNCRQFMYLAISLLVLRAGCGIWLYQFLIVACLFTFLIKLGGCPGWCESSTGAYAILLVLSWGGSFGCNYASLAYISNIQKDKIAVFTHPCTRCNFLFGLFCFENTFWISQSWGLQAGRSGYSEYTYR